MLPDVIRFFETPQQLKIYIFLNNEVDSNSIIVILK